MTRIYHRQFIVVTEGLFIANGVDRCKGKNTHTHTRTPHCLTCAIVWQSEFVRCCEIVKCVRDIVKISICFIPQIIVYKDGQLLGFEQTPKWIAFKNASVYFVISLSQALATYFPFHLIYTLILYSNYYWISRCLEKKLMIRE